MGPTPGQAQQAQDAPAAPATSPNLESRIYHTQHYMGETSTGFQVWVWSDLERRRPWPYRLTGSLTNRGHAPRRCHDRAGKTRHPSTGTSRLHSATSADDSDAALSARPSSGWTGDHDIPPGDDQLGYPFRPLAATTAPPREGRRAPGGAPSGGRQSRERAVSGCSKRPNQPCCRMCRHPHSHTHPRFPVRT